MNEYITKEDARLNRPEWREAIDDFSAGFNVCIDEYIDRIDEIPAADVAPVRHGRWINFEWKSLNTFSVKCNQCGIIITTSVNYSFCPNCGAKMDGDGE